MSEREIDEPTEAMIDAGVAFALQVCLSSTYTWSDYVRDLYKNMRAAASIGKAQGGE